VLLVRGHQQHGAVNDAHGTRNFVRVDTTTSAPGTPCNNATGIQLTVRTYDSTGTLADKPFYLRADGPAPTG
jgi:hypothetical protein